MLKRAKLFCYDGHFLQNTFCAACLTLRVGLVFHHSFHLFHPRLRLFSLLPPVPLFSPTLPTVSPSPSLCSSVILPRLFHLPLTFFLPICFLFSAVSSTVLLCFSSSDPTLEHLKEIRRKLASKKPAVKGSSTPFALQFSAQHCETFRPSSFLSEKQVVSRRTMSCFTLWCTKPRVNCHRPAFQIRG